MTQGLVYIGVTHQTAPLSIRERFAADRDGLPALLARVRDHAAECVILSTCGRFEVYAWADTAEAETWRRRFAELFAVPSGLVGRHARVRIGASAAEHLLRVAAGLESQIIGDEQVVGQVREAFGLACRTRSIGPMLSALFRAAIHVGKRVRRETTVCRAAHSFAELAVGHVARTIDAIEGQTVLVVGSGNLAGRVVSHLADSPRGRLVLASRYVDRARGLAGRAGGLGIDLTSLPEWVRRADAVVTCTSSPRFVITPEMIRRDGRTTTVVDLGMPRNVDPAVGHVKGVRLCPMDALVPAGGPGDEAVGAAERIIAEELARFVEWMRLRRLGPEIARLVRRVEGGSTKPTPEMKRQLHALIVRLKREGQAA
ncbi:MAG: glutamyl-tRNA reductase [Phycisphaerae bacterium]